MKCHGTTHNTRTDCWLIIKDKVYDVTLYVEEHPGGDGILTHAGDDATIGFYGPQHGGGVFQLIKRLPHWRSCEVTDCLCTLTTLSQEKLQVVLSFLFFIITFSFNYMKLSASVLYLCFTSYLNMLLCLGLMVHVAHSVQIWEAM